MNTRSLPVQLNEEEIKIKGEELAKAVKEHKKLEDEKKSVAATYGKQLKNSSFNVLELSHIVETGKEDRDVPVRKEFNARLNLCNVYREDTGDLVEARPMEADEHQNDLWEEETILEERD